MIKTTMNINKKNQIFGLHSVFILTVLPVLTPLKLKLKALPTPLINLMNKRDHKLRAYNPSSNYFRIGMGLERGVQRNYLGQVKRTPLASKNTVMPDLGPVLGQRPFSEYFLSDFVDIQRKSFFTLLEKGLIEEFSKRNPITNLKKTMEVFFYPEYYQLTPPEYSPNKAIIKSKSYTSRLYIPIQLTDKTTNTIKLKWVYIGNIPLMTKRGHFILNGCARVIVNQMIRSPGIYYQKKIYENYPDKWSEKPESIFERHYADLICNRGTWLRIEVGKDNQIWAQMKRVPKIPMMWLLIAMGLSEKIILKRVMDSQMLLYTFQEDSPTQQKQLLGGQPVPYVKSPPTAWAAIYNLVVGRRKKAKKAASLSISNKSKDLLEPQNLKSAEGGSSPPLKKNKSASKANKGKPRGVGPEGTPSSSKKKNNTLPSEGVSSRASHNKVIAQKARMQVEELGRKWIFNKFMNPRTYDLGEIGRLNFNRKLNLSVDLNQTTLTPQDLLLATDHLILVSKGLRELDDIDHLKNRRVRTSGELIQLQIGIGLVRLEKTIREKLNKIHASALTPARNIKTSNSLIKDIKKGPGGSAKLLTAKKLQSKSANKTSRTASLTTNLKTKANVTINRGSVATKENFTISNIMNTKPFNGALKEFFGSNPLSQFMDQINPLAELTHKRRLSSMGPGGVTRDSATLEIRGIHPSHYGRICPVETPEGKNTGLVNSLTAYARVNSQGYIETPFYRVYKGQVQKKAGLFFLSAKQEENIKLGASDLYTSDIGFLPLASIPVRIAEDFTKIPRNELQYVGVAPIQMISIATSLIPFFEHDDGNRALMGSNMQRQAVPILKPQRPIVGTGLEARAVSDSGHVLQAKASGVVTYVSSSQIKIYTLER